MHAVNEPIVQTSVDANQQFPLKISPLIQAPRNKHRRDRENVENIWRIHLTLELTITSVHGHDAENGCLLCVISGCLNKSTFIVGLRVYTLKASRRKHRDLCFSCYMKSNSTVP